MHAFKDTGIFKLLDNSDSVVHRFLTSPFFTVFKLSHHWKNQEFRDAQNMFYNETIILQESQMQAEDLPKTEYPPCLILNVQNQMSHSANVQVVNGHSVGQLLATETSKQDNDEKTIEQSKPSSHTRSNSPQIRMDSLEVETDQNELNEGQRPIDFGTKLFKKRKISKMKHKYANRLHSLKENHEEELQTSEDVSMPCS